jgi:DNA-directed RNA polymerase specialized sigma24 family protein
MKKINNNQLAAFININREFYYKLAYSYVHNNNEALLTIKVAICKAFETIKNLSNPLALKSWFYQIIVDTSIDYLNNKKKFIIVKMEDNITIPVELEELVKQTIEAVNKRVELKKYILNCILSVVIALVIIAYIYNFIKFIF